MKALALVDRMEFAVVERATPAPGPAEVVIRVGAVGLCGTDFHIFQGDANYNFDAHGRQIPLLEHAQVLGHEFCGTVVEKGSQVTRLSVGDRVVVDQGVNCSSRGRLNSQWCEYCSTGSTHQCIDYQEMGITGHPGALAEYISVPASNAVRIESGLPFEEAALCEPLGCILHACEMQLRTSARFSFGGSSAIRSVLISGAGPAGILFTQYLRSVLGFDGLILAVEPNLQRRKLVSGFGADCIDPLSQSVVDEVREKTSGQGVHYLIEASGSAIFFASIPALLRKQGTLMMYGHGHHGEDLGIFNLIQFLEPAVLAPCGASGALDSKGLPETTARSLELLEHGVIEVGQIISHRYESLQAVPRAFSEDRFKADYVKGVVVLTQSQQDSEV